MAIEDVAHERPEAILKVGLRRVAKGPVVERVSQTPRLDELPALTVTALVPGIEECTALSRKLLERRRRSRLRRSRRPEYGARPSRLYVTT